MVRGGIDDGERSLRHGAKDMARGVADVAAMSRRPQCDGGGALAFHIGARHRAVTLIEGPNGACARSEEPRIGAGRYGGGHFSRLDIDPRYLGSLGARDPYRAAAEFGVVGTCRYCIVAENLSAAGLNSRQVAGFIDEPHASGTV